MINEARPGYHLIFRKWRHDPKTGRLIYGKAGRAIPMWVKD